MIARTRIDCTRRELAGYNELGEPIYSTTTATYYGELTPLGSDEPTRAGTTDNPVVTRYRLVLPRSATLTAGDAVTVFGEAYDLLGEPERHTLNGLAHHYEAIEQRRTG